MAAPGGKFFIQDSMDKVAPHHESFEKVHMLALELSK